MIVPMAVVPLTLAISLCLVFTFVAFFLREHARGRLNSAERDSLLPLADETPRFELVRANPPASTPVPDIRQAVISPPSAVSSKAP
jgi:hypothetical protein